MTLKQRLERLEQAAPLAGDIGVAWRSVVHRDEQGRLVEAVHSAHILAGPHGPAETLERNRRQGEHRETFLARVLEAARRIHGRSDPEFDSAVQWTPQPDTHHPE